MSASSCPALILSVTRFCYGNCCCLWKKRLVQIQLQATTSFSWRTRSSLAAASSSIPRPAYTARSSKKKKKTLALKRAWLEKAHLESKFYCFSILGLNGTGSGRGSCWKQKHQHCCFSSAWRWCFESPDRVAVGLAMAGTSPVPAESSRYPRLFRGCSGRRK